MDKKDPKSSANKEKLANTLLTAIILLIGIMLFLMTDKGSEMLASIGLSKDSAEYDYTVIGENSDTDEFYDTLSEPADIIDAMLAEWPNSTSQMVYADAGKEEYTVSSDLFSIQIDFESTDGVFNTIDVKYSVVSEPDKPDGDLTPIQQYIYNKEYSSYEGHCNEVRIMLNALLTALNGGSDGIDTTLNMLHSAAISAEESSKVNSFNSLNTDFRIYTIGLKDEKSVAINIEINKGTE